VRRVFSCSATIKHPRNLKAKMKHSTKGWFRRKPGVDHGDWMLHSELYKHHSKQFAKVKGGVPTVDCASCVGGANSFCSTYFSKANSFLSVNPHELTKHHKLLYANPDFRLMDAYLDKFLQLKKCRADVDIMLVAPIDTTRKWYPKLCKHFSCMAVYKGNWRHHDGGRLFSRPVDHRDPGGARVCPGGAPFDVGIFFSKSGSKIHSTSSYENDAVKKMSIGKLALLRGRLLSQNTAVLLDSGAQCSLISEKLVAKLGIATHCMEGVNLEWFDGSAMKQQLCVKDVHLTLNGKAVVLEDAIVAPLSTFDVVLGTPWLDTNHVVMHFHPSPHLRKVVVDGQTLTPLEHMSRQPSSRPLVSVCSIAQAKKYVKKHGTQVLVGRLKVLVDSVTTGDNGVKTSFSDRIGPDAPPEIRKKLLDLLHEFQDIFEEPTQTIDYPAMELELKPGEEAFAASPYRLSLEEQQALDELIELFIKRGWIVPSNSGWGSPCMLVKKAKGGWRLVIDFRALNSKTLGHSWPLPRLDDVLQSLRGSKVYSGLDLLSGYHQLALHENSQEMTAFTTKNGLYHWLVTPQGLKQAPGAFSKMMSTLFKEIVSAGCMVVYLDDMLVHTTDWTSHVDALRKVFTVFREKHLRAALNKCQFGFTSIEFVGHKVSAAGVLPDDRKSKAIREWPVPTDRQSLYQFYGLVAWFRRMFPTFTELTKPLQDQLYLKKEGEDIEWGPEQQACFDAVKEAFANLVHMHQFNPSLESCVWVDASDYAVGGALLQRSSPTSDWYPCAFESKRLTQHECSWHTTDKEMYAVVVCLNSWKHWLKGGHHFTVHTDHIALCLKPTSKVKRSRALRWHQELSEFDFSLQHKSGLSNVLGDAMSRRPDHMHWFKSLQKPVYGPVFVEEGVQVGVMYSHINGIAKKKKKRVSWAPLLHVSSISHAGVHAIAMEAQLDEALKTVLVADASSYVPPQGHALKKDSLGLWRTAAGQIYVNGQDARAAVVSYIHEHHFHCGHAKTSRRLKQLFHWKTQQKTVGDVIKGCQTCQAVKALRKKLTKTHSVSEGVASKLTHLQVDFVWGLPIVTPKRLTGLMNIVDVFSKYCVLIPVPFNIDSEYCARMVMDHWVRHFGPPMVLQSDQDVRFTSALYQSLVNMMGVEMRLSSPYHPQSQGVCERLNGIAVDALRTYVMDKGSHTKWHEIIPWLNFVLNSNHHSTINMSPHECVFGVPLRTMPGMHVVCEGISSDDQDAMKDYVKSRLMQQAVEQRERLDGSGVAWDPKVGDLVWLASDHLKWKKQAKAKLVPRFLGPFKVLHKPAPNAVKLELPSTWNCRSTWNVDALKPHVESVWSQAPVAADWSEEILELMSEDQAVTDSVAQPLVDPKEGVKTVLEVKRGTKDMWLVRFTGDKGFQDKPYTEQEVKLLPDGVVALEAHHAKWQNRPRRGS